MHAQQGQCDCRDVARCVLLCTAIAEYAEKCLDTGCREAWRGRCGGMRGYEEEGSVGVEESQIDLLMQSCTIP